MSGDTVCSVVLELNSEATEMSLDLSSDFLHFKIGMAKASKHRGYAFGAFRLDRDKRMLYRDETEISLPPKVVETLIVLVENQGEIVSKAELMERVWADSVVEESNLSQHLYLLRRTLGDAGNGRPVIETLRRRGYRFTAEATVIGTEPEPKPEHLPRQAPANFAVRRRGNVLTVADWEAAPEPRPQPVEIPPEPQGVVDKKPGSATLRYAAAGFVALAVLISAYILWPVRNVADTSKVGDIVNTFLTNGRPIESLAISTDGNYFVYSEKEAPHSSLWLQQTGQSSRLEIVPAAERSIGPKTFSPDGQFVYFVSLEKGEIASSLYRVPTLGGLYTKVLENVATPVTLSPDGTEMAFVRLDTEKPSATLVVASTLGSPERTLLKREGNQSTLGVGSAWSPDGRRIAFASIEIDKSGRGFTRISEIDLSSGEVAAISPELWDTSYRMQWAADGRGLVFIGTRDGESLSSRRDQIYFISYPDGRSRKLTSEGNRHDPASLGITANDEILVLPMGRSSQIWAMDASGDSRTAVQITKGLLDGRAGIAPLPDGRVGYVTRTGENVNVWIMNEDGSGQRQLTSEPSFAEELRASKDGTFFVFSGAVNGRSHLFRIDPDGSNQVQITTGNGSEVDSTISTDGVSVVYSASAYGGVHAKTLLWKVSAAGGPPEQFAPKECASPHYSPDGQLISCILEENRILILRTSDGTLLSTLTARPFSKLNFGALWTPDGKSVTYISTENGTTNLWTHPISNGEPLPLTNFSGGDVYRFAFSNDGGRLFVARGYPIHDAMLIKNFR